MSKSILERVSKATQFMILILLCVLCSCSVSGVKTTNVEVDGKIITVKYKNATKKTMKAEYSPYLLTAEQLRAKAKELDDTVETKYSSHKVFLDGTTKENAVKSAELIWFQRYGLTIIGKYEALEVGYSKKSNAWIVYGHPGPVNFSGALVAIEKTTGEVLLSYCLF